MTDEEKRFDRKEEARLDDMYDAQCERCGEVNPAEIHTCSPQREWVGLTDEEILEEYRQSYGDDGDLTDVYFARAIEAKLKEKNT